MDKERLFRYLDRKYSSKSEIIPNIPLGVDADAIWSEILQSRRERGIELPLVNVNGDAYWYILTNKMISASEVIVDELLEQESTAEPHKSSVSTIEEIYYTGFMEGAQISVQDAMDFLQSGTEPSSVEELILINSRQAAGFAAENMYHAIDSNYLHNLAYFLTDGLENGGGDYRITDTMDIPSLQGENVKLPPANMIPDLVNQITGFIADSKTHPLIKAAAAQAWVLAVRPFPEGNERLARILSSVILIRAGYSFFGEISISSIIARTSYEYFRAIANILRVENGADLTYFLEYYLVALSDAVNEMKAKKTQQTQDMIMEEQRQALLPLSMDQTTVTKQNHGKGYKAVGTALKKMKEQGISTFSNKDVQSLTGLSYKYVYAVLSQYEAESHIVVTSRGKGGNVYAFTGEAPYDDITDDAIQLTLQESEINGSRDALISALHKQQKKGSNNVVLVASKLLEYVASGRKQFTSAEIAGELGLTIVAVRNCVKPLKEKGYIVSTGIKKNQNIFAFAFIAGQVSPENTVQSDTSALTAYLSEMIQKRKGRHPAAFAKQMIRYLAEGRTEFTSADFTGPLNMHPTMSNEYLRELRDKGLLTTVPSNGKKNVYALLIAAHPALEDDQKNTLRLLYDVFGEESFSTEMVIAQLDYSEGQVTGILNQFTWMNLLNRTSDQENRDYYKLCVNPTDNPECFGNAA